MTLEIFGPTINTKWNAKSYKLKDDLINYLAIPFGDTFNKRGVTTKASAYLKYVRDQYMVHIQKTLGMSILQCFQKRCVRCCYTKAHIYNTAVVGKIGRAHV